MVYQLYSLMLLFCVVFVCCSFMLFCHIIGALFVVLLMLMLLLVNHVASGATNSCIVGVVLGLSPCWFVVLLCFNYFVIVIGAIIGSSCS